MAFHKAYGGGSAQAKGSRIKVMNGSANATAGGLDKSQLMKNKNGRIVPKSKHAAGKKNNWTKAANIAAKELGISGADRIKQMRKGTAYYKVTKSHFDRMQKAEGKKSKSSTKKRAQSKKSKSKTKRRRTARRGGWW